MRWYLRYSLSLRDVEGDRTRPQSGHEQAAWEVRFGSEYAPGKQRAWDATVAALRKVREEATWCQAVRPMIGEYERQQACQRKVGRVDIFDATGEEEEAATEELRKALAALPIGAAPKQLEAAEETALASCRSLFVTAAA